MSTLSNTTEGRTVGPDSRPVVSAELLDVRDIAALLGGCSPRHVFRLSDSGRMPPPLRLGALVRWRRTEVMDWIAAGCPPLRPQKAAPR